MREVKLVLNGNEYILPESELESIIKANELNKTLQNKSQEYTLLLYKDNKTVKEIETQEVLKAELQESGYGLPADPLYAEYLKARDKVLKTIKDNKDYKAIETLFRILKLGD